MRLLSRIESQVFSETFVVHHPAIGADALVGMLAPGRIIGAHIELGVVARVDKQAFPAQMGAAVRSDFRDQFHTYPFAASTALSSARLTATLASVTLYAFWVSGRASATAALPAASAVASVTCLPASERAAAAESHGAGATWPSTIFADFTVRPFISSATEAVASGQSSAVFCRTS